MAEREDFFVRFWGVRGSVACGSPTTARYGGNTSSLEVRCGDRLLMLDAGTGLRYLGNSIAGDTKPLSAHIYLTHTHYDHVVGMPFFRPAFVPTNKFEVWAGHLAPLGENILGVLQQHMTPPLFPVPLEIFQSDMTYNDFRAGETLQPYPDIELRTAPLNHPNGATAYRINFQGKSICYLTDTEHYADRLDEKILELIDGADIVIYDSTYTDEEYPTRVGWGHSTWPEGVKLCEEAGVGQFVVFHHDPDHDDDFMDGIAKQVAERRPGSVVAVEGMVLRPGDLEPSKS